PIRRREAPVEPMTQAPPPRSGMPAWAKWSLWGCGGCLTVLLVMAIAGVVLVGRNIKIAQFNASNKPDPPPGATANQLMPRRVGKFVLQSRSRANDPQVGTSSGWEGKYSSGGRSVALVVVPTAEARRGGNSRSPFGSAMQRSGQNPNQGVQVSYKIGDKWEQ